MAQYIDKAAVVAEIERRIKEHHSGYLVCLKDILSFLDTLEVKEVDLEKEIELIKGDYEQVDVAWNNDFDYIARHFFELGLKAHNNNKVD